MSKTSKGKKVESVWDDPSMQALDDLTKKILKVPKSELDKNLAQERGIAASKAKS